MVIIVTVKIMFKITNVHLQNILYVSHLTEWHLSLNFFHYQSYQPSEKSLPLLLHLQALCVYCLKNVIIICFRYITHTQ